MKLGLIGSFFLVVGCVAYLARSRPHGAAGALGGVGAIHVSNAGFTSTKSNQTTRSPSNLRSRQKLLSGKDKRFVISVELPENDFNLSLLELIRSTPSEQLDELLNFVRNAQESVEFPISSSWIHYPAVRQPNEFFRLVENGRLTRDEIDIGMRSVATLYPDLAFLKFEDLDLANDFKQSLANDIVTSWMEQDSVAASAAVIAMGERNSIYTRSARLAVAEWLHTKGDDESASLWKK